MVRGLGAFFLGALHARRDGVDAVVCWLRLGALSNIRRKPASEVEEGTWNGASAGGTQTTQTIDLVCIHGCVCNCIARYPLPKMRLVFFFFFPSPHSEPPGLVTKGLHRISGLPLKE